MTGDSASTEAIAETAEAEGPGAAGTAAAAGTGAGAEAAAGTGVEDAEELLVEEISIDGMCGVY
ncbi:MAG TPA: mycofactocin precursor MftA [Streptosporangiaceae bacterium]|jgi:mycofactocin precursor|nr:mycofactocin precursor MftA [Streptosporangiaceae bacterium]